MAYKSSPEEEKKEILFRYKNILKSAYVKINEREKELLREALDLMMDAHKGIYRKSGEPYLFHPLAVAQIVAEEIGLGATAIIAALLHDVVEDSDYTKEDLEKRFGTKVANIVQGLTKIKKVKNTNVSLQAENFRKMILTLSDDIRVILIKLADRLHNMQTLDAMPHHKQLKIASETLYLYAPLAHELGLYNIKNELEDLGLKYTQPKQYQHIQQKEKESRESQQAYVESFAKSVEEDLIKNGIDYQIQSRSKSIYSIWNKMEKQNIPYEDVFDKFAIRIIFDAQKSSERSMAWQIYSIVTQRFKPNTKRLRDWISVPKPVTGYEALHATVLGPLNRWVEVQIRSKRMHEIAEHGHAAHYKYKNVTDKDTSSDKWVKHFKKMLEGSPEDTIEFVDDFKTGIHTKEIYVYTPQGKLISLPKGASGLDFAYAIHTELGEKCTGVKVDKILRPLNYVLQNSQMVEIITSADQKPKQDWLKFVKTGRAKSKIKASLRAFQEKQITIGKEKLIRKLRHLKVNFDKKIEDDMVKHFSLQNSREMFLKVEEGAISNDMIREFTRYRNTILRRIFKKKTRPIGVIPPPKSENKQHNFLVFGPKRDKLEYRLAACCRPVLGDQVFGFTSLNGLKVHRKDCPNALELQSQYSYRIMPADWATENDKMSNKFMVNLEIRALDKPALANQIIEIVSVYMKMNLKNISFGEEKGMAKGLLTLEVLNNTQLNKLIRKLKSIKEITKVDRV